MPYKPSDSSLGAFLKALREEEIPNILIGAMAAIEQGAPLMTVDYDFSILASCGSLWGSLAGWVRRWTSINFWMLTCV